MVPTTVLVANDGAALSSVKLVLVFWGRLNVDICDAFVSIDAWRVHVVICARIYVAYVSVG